MLMPTLFDRDFFNDFFDDPFFGSKDMKKMEKKMNSRRAQNLMKTDVRETADAYEMKVELPGFKKENVKISLENGYLTINAEKNSQRSFYVGDEIHEDQIRAEFRHGILKIDLPKKKEVPAVEETKYISIE